MSGHIIKWGEREGCDNASELMCHTYLREWAGEAR